MVLSSPPHRRSTSRFSRRRLLGSLGAAGGAYLCAPLTGTLIRQAEGATRKNLVFFTSGNGIDTRRYGIDDGASSDFTGAGRPREIFEPLMPFKSKMLVVDRLYNPHGLGLHGNGTAAMTLMPTEDDSVFSGITLDRLVAQKLGQQDAISSLHLMGYGMDRAKHVGRSADGPNKPYPFEWIPAVAFEKTFGGASGADDADAVAAAALRQAQKKSVLDTLAGRIALMKSQIGGPEREKLDQMLDSVRALETRIDAAAAAPASCKEPFTLPTSGLPQPGANYREFYADQTTRGPVMDAMVDIAAAAMTCGLTHVALIILSEGSPHNRVPGVSSGHHSLCHEEKTSAHLITKIDQYHCSLVARLAAALDEAPGGNGGTMLDDSAVVWMSEGGGSHHGGSYKHPLITVGRAGGALRSGRYIKLGASEVGKGDPRLGGTPTGSERIPGVGSTAPDHCVSEAMLALALAMGVNIDKFGDPAHCKAPLQEILA